MGREAIVTARIDGMAGEVKALLESHELILRGPLRRRFARSAIEEIAVIDGALTFRCTGEAVRLELGPVLAETWQRVLLTPPPSLRDKLGLAGEARALFLGPADEPVLAAALEGRVTPQLADATMVIARVDSGEDLDRARQAGFGLPLWVVYAKGKAATFGDGQVRALLRAAGWRDTKTCAVSDRFGATRYHPPRMADPVPQGRDGPAG